MGILANKDFSTNPGMTVGDNLSVFGNAAVKKNLLVEGWFEAKNIVGACKGLFASEDALKTSYPKPLPGWYAFVGDTFPADIYRAEYGGWVATGKQGYPAEDYEEFVKEDDLWSLLLEEEGTVIKASLLPALSELSGTLSNDQLENSSVTIAGALVELGGELSVDTIATALTNAGYKLTDTVLTEDDIWGFLQDSGDEVIAVNHIPALSLLSGTLSNSQLENSSISIAGTAVSLGGSITVDTIATALTNAGYNFTDTVGEGITLADVWTALQASGSEVIDASHIPTITNDKLANSSMTIAGTLVELGGELSVDTIATALTNAGYKLTDTVGEGSGGTTDTATKLATARTLWGQSFDGSADVSGDMTDVGSITASGLATLNGGVNTNKITLVNGDYTVTISLDENGYVHVDGGLYADSFLSVGGSDSDSGESDSAETLSFEFEDPVLEMDGAGNEVTQNISSNTDWQLE